jgi:23S rRNA U2552 (ribose-2'-O)-methylase RlmE/FtsJ
MQMESTFGQDILTKKSFFGFKRKKSLNKKSRLFNKELGGGAILDLGCYPVSLSNLIASLISNLNYEKIKVINKKKRYWINRSRY